MENSGVEKPELPASSKRPAPYEHGMSRTARLTSLLSLLYTLFSRLHTLLSLLHTVHHQLTLLHHRIHTLLSSAHTSQMRQTSHFTTRYSLYYKLLSLRHTLLSLPHRAQDDIRGRRHYSCTQHTTRVLNTLLPIQQTKRAANSLNPES